MSASEERSITLTEVGVVLDADDVAGAREASTSCTTTPPTTPPPAASRNPSSADATTLPDPVPAGTAGGAEDGGAAAEYHNAWCGCTGAVPAQIGCSSGEAAAGVSGCSFS